MAHTPGPWEVRVESDGWDGKTTAIYGRDNALVLNGWGYAASGIYWGQSDHGAGSHDSDSDPALPDARLIAAAPELLEALKRAVVLLDAAAEWCPQAAEFGFKTLLLHDGKDASADGVGFGTDCENASDRAKSAIAKAEGEPAVSGSGKE